MEEYKKPEFTITPILNPETKEYSLNHFDEVKEACEGFIEENTIEEINSDDDYKTLKTCRSNIRKKSEQIKSARIALTKLFSFQFKALESMLNEADAKMKQLKEEFEASKTPVQAEEVKPNDNLEEITLIIKSRDANIIEQLKKLAVEKGCLVIEAKEK